ncbi:MAG: DUF1987 domain-containing protein [Flavobacteriales bacterium]|nr:DUF1987 domain-containing protein [Flavobacteriales bacterium]MCB9166302.1 DUF1987 domain-containing protein [Flavobacteriales bacterium]
MAERLELPATAKTPLVSFDPDRGTLIIRGVSIHENADGFYTPIHALLERYMAAPANRTQIEVELAYFNSSSAKYLLDLFKLMDDLHASGGSKVELTWVYRADDLDMEEAGNDYRGLLDLPVRLKPSRG